MASSLARLTSLSTQTLSLLLERQRLQSLSSSIPNSNGATTSNLHIPQITRNLKQLRVAILEAEEKDLTTGGEGAEAIKLLKSQYGRMRGMLGEEVCELQGVETFPETKPEVKVEVDEVVVDDGDRKELQRSQWGGDEDRVYTPYQDEPEVDPSMMLQQQRDMMSDQDTHLENLSHSITRQHHLSLQINDELDTHTGLLEELDTDLDRTHSRLARARKSLDKVAKGAKNHGSTVTIALLILILLILIIVFKT
ncbi:uncharacterized protein STEHIDRAFT_148708 [Stereum hirsutum FP-91666 SS1]|uniref:uncharacterized protein n=1 Tax=Stereum hirsutum (strain FP-91666) TaxID=721885 RepID=UPI000444A8A9|nr:uncharacterized protein STEHIDRAFT_148708 [Stereum hirsutum FP-91666 SS1]EIM83978.1 hypothetical protein STEHIDRAFT_148708 [Stereum hirsutum FP-91666 SS1]